MFEADVLVEAQEQKSESFTFDWWLDLLAIW